MEADLQEEFTGVEDRHFLFSLLSQVKKLPDALKLQMRTEMMQVVMKYTQPLPPSHFVQPYYFHQRPDPNMPRIGETKCFMEMTNVFRPTHSSSVTSSSAP
jgi:hypothetical protein